MKKISLLLTALILFSCASVEEAGKVLRNEKIKTNDEFLVKKKDPLILPPDHKKIPEPGSIANDKKSDTQRIKKILKVPKDKSAGVNKSSSVEKSILEKIRK